MTETTTHSRTARLEGEPLSLHSLVGSCFHRRIEDMLGWHFYDTPEWMNNAYATRPCD